MFSLDYAGPAAFDVRTKRGAYCGVIAQSPKGDWRVYFNSNATKGSQRRFPTPEAAIAFIYERRVKKGWGF